MGDPRGGQGTGENIVLKGTLRDIKIGRTDSSRRAITVRTFWETKRRRRRSRLIELAIPGTDFRKWVGVGRLKSTAFEVSAEKPGVNVYSFRGKGYGHGVGMCQWGAKAMGDMGYTAKVILGHYYPNAKLRKLW